MPRGYQPPINEDEKLLCKKVSDLVKACDARGVAKFTAFLDERGQVLAKAELARLKWTEYTFFGGYGNAERQMLCVYENEVAQEDWPIETIEVTCAGAKNLTHRDFLGAIMALNIKRECLGDIVIKGQTATVFAQKNVAQVINNELISVGRYGASCQMIAAEALVAAEKKTAVESTIPVASLRLDAVLSGMLHVSRSGAAQLIKSGAVQINHIAAASLHSTLYEDDIFSIKGYGKYKLNKIGGLSKKGRIFIEYLKY